MKQIPFTSISQDWRTPSKVYAGLHAEFGFKFDPCPAHALVDGLAVEWGSPAYVNPPFKDIAKWVRKAWDEYSKGKTVVLLIPSRTDTRWWHDYCMRATEIRFLKGRLKYEGAKFNAPFPSCVVVFAGQSAQGGGEWIHTYPEMNEKIVEILRVGSSVSGLYAAQRIVELEGKAFALQAKVAELEEANAGLEADTDMAIDLKHGTDARVHALEAALTLILPMAKGYAAVHPVGSNLAYIEGAEKALRPDQGEV